MFKGLKTFIKDFDAHMFIDNLKRKHEMNALFYYAYDVDNESRLKKYVLDRWNL